MLRMAETERVGVRQRLDVDREIALADHRRSLGVWERLSTMLRMAKAERVLVGQGGCGSTEEIAGGDAVGDACGAAQIGGHDIDRVDDVLDLVIGANFDGLLSRSPIATASAALLIRLRPRLTPSAIQTAMPIDREDPSGDRRNQHHLRRRIAFVGLGFRALRSVAIWPSSVTP